MNDTCKTEQVTLQENGIVRNDKGEILGRLGRSVARDDIVAAVAQAWCTPENEHKEMDSTLAEAVIINIANIMDNCTSGAMDALKHEMQKDSEQGSYAHSWHCNIAMMCYDAIRAECPPTSMPHEDAHKIGNDAASRFMKLCFDVDTRA